MESIDISDFYIPYLFVLTFLAIMGIVVQPYRFRNILVLVVFVLGLIVGFTSFTNLLGKPRLMETGFGTQFPDTEVATVIGFEIVEDEHIYVLLTWEDRRVPVYYVLPWEQTTAQQLHDAAEKTKQRNNGDPNGVQMIIPRGRTSVSFGPTPEPLVVNDKPETNQNLHEFDPND